MDKHEHNHHHHKVDKDEHIDHNKVGMNHETQDAHNHHHEEIHHHHHEDSQKHTEHQNHDKFVVDFGEIPD